MGIERVVEVGHPVGQVVPCDGKQLLVGVRENVEPGFIGDFGALVTDVEEGGRGRVVEGRGVTQHARRHGKQQQRKQDAVSNAAQENEILNF